MENDAHFHSTPRSLWTSSPAFGIVHTSRCQTCHQYMTHLAEASHSDDDPSFKVALKERDFQRNSHYLNGVCEGRRLQRESIQVDQLERCRAERDAALEIASQHFIDLCAVQEQLETLEEEYRALQDLFEEVAEFNGGRFRTGSRSPSIDPRVLEESLYDTLPGFEDELSHPWPLRPHSPIRTSIPQLPTPPGSAAGSATWHPAELPSLADDACLETASSAVPNVILEPLQTYPSPNPSVSGDEPETAPTFVEDSVTDNCMTLPRLYTPETVEQLQSLMNDASAGDEQALTHVKVLCTHAHGALRKQRTELQWYLLCNWKGVAVPGRALPTVRVESSGSSHVVGGTALVKHEIFVDSAPSWGIGFIMNGRWLAWKFKRGWNTEGKDNSWGEMVAVELGLRVAIAAGYHTGSITMRSDNAGVVQSLSRGISKNFQQNLILQKILQLCRTYQIHLKPVWISTKINPADNPSRGIFASRTLLFPDPPALPTHLVDFLLPPVEFRELRS